MSPVVYLISGANRGIGLGFVSYLALRENVVLFAGARSPAPPRSCTRWKLSTPGKVHTVKLTSNDKVDNEAAVATIKRVAGRLDVVIANAGIANCLEAEREVMLEHFDISFLSVNLIACRQINVCGPVTLFQATWPLLHGSTTSPKFICISTVGSTIAVGATLPAGLLVYGTSKCALNYTAVKLAHEYAKEGLLCFPMHPGELVTDMFTFALKDPGLAAMMRPITVEEGVQKMMNVIDNAKQEEEPKFYNNDGGVWPF